MCKFNYRHVSCSQIIKEKNPYDCNFSSLQQFPGGFHGTYKCWAEPGAELGAVLSKALTIVDDGLSIRKVAKMYSIPKSTLHDHVFGKVDMEQTVGLIPI